MMSTAFNASELTDSTGQENFAKKNTFAAGIRNYAIQKQQKLVAFVYHYDRFCKSSAIKSLVRISPHHLKSLKRIET